MRIRTPYWFVALFLQAFVVLGMASCGGDDSSTSSSSSAGGTGSKDASTDGITPGSEGGTTTLKPAVLKLDPPTAHFGSVLIGDKSPTTTFTVSNTGGDLSGPLTATVTGDGAASFTLTNNCSAVLAANATCTIGVQFVPGTAGQTSATLTVAGTPGGTVTANVDGDGVEPGGLSVTADTNDLGSAVVGQTATTTATFTVKNTGDDPSGQITIQAAGSDPTNFKVTNDDCTGMTLQPADTCTFTVSFVPLTRGTKSATFEVTSTPGGTVNATVGGTALAPAHLTTLTPELTFGSVVVGKTSGTVKLFIANDGDVKSDKLTQTLGGTDASIFTVLSSTCDGAAVEASNSCEVDLQLAPLATTPLGPKMALITVAGGTAGSLATTLSGSVISPNQLTVDPATNTFTPTLVSSTSSAQVFTVTNGGSAASGAIVTTIGGTDPTQFAVVPSSDACDGVSLPVGGTCTISIAFAPTHRGAAAASVTFTSLNSGVATSAISGVGLTPAQLTVTPPDEDFGGVTRGTKSASQIFTIQNTGTQSSGITATKLTGVDATAFTIVNDGCNIVLGAAQTCTVEVLFAPTAERAHVAALEVTGTPGGTAHADLKGDGQSPVGLSISPSTFAFPTTLLGDTAAPQTFTVVNLGGDPISVNGVTTSGTNASDFVASSDCQTVAAGGRCTLTVTFKPTAGGRREASVLLNAANGSARLALSGQAQAKLEVIALDNGPEVDPFDFGDLVINNGVNHDVLVTIRNNTAATKPLTLTSDYGSPAQFATISSTCDPAGTIAGNGGTCVVRVRAKTTTDGAKTGALTASIDATTSVTQHFTANGVDGLKITAVTSTDFGNVPSGTTSTPQNFKVTNAVGSVTTGPLSASLDDNSQFKIVPVTAQAAALPDCANATLDPGGSCLIAVTFSPLAPGQVSAKLTVTATPGGTASITLTGTAPGRSANPDLAPTDLNITAANTYAGCTAPCVSENVNNAVVGTFVSTDPDSTTWAYTFVVGGADNSAFTISGNTFRTSGSFDFETKSTYSIRVRTTDDGGQFFEKNFTINVLDINDAPSFTVANETVLENAGAQSFAGWATAVKSNDTTAQTPLTYHVTGNNLTSLFSVQPAVDASGTLTFTPAAHQNGTAQITITLQDSGGTSNGGVDTSTPQNFSISVTSVNDAPAGTDGSVTTLEETAYVFKTADFGFTDPNDSPPNALLAVKITTLPTGGVLSDNSVAVSAGQFIPVGDITGGLLKFTPTANFAGAPTFTFQVQDDGGTASGGVNLDASPNTLTINVTNVSDAPVGSNTSVTGLQATAYTFLQTDFGFSDPNDSPPDTLSGVKIASLPAAGTLADNGVPVSVGQVILLADITGGKLKFTGTPTGSGAPYTAFTLQVQDTGSTANGGVILAAAPSTVTINLTNINDPPVGADKTVTTLEDSLYTFAVADFGFTDPNDAPANNLANVIISALPSAGSLTLGGVPVTPNQAVPVGGITGGSLKLAPAANANGTPYTSFQFKLQDDGGTASGGHDTETTAHTIALNVTPVNDVPSFTIAGNPASSQQDAGGQTVVGFATGISAGPADESGQTLTFTAAVGVTTGTLAFSAAPAVSSTGTLTYTASAGTSGTASISLTLKDSGGTANGGVDTTAAQTFTITVNALNSQPVLGGAANTVAYTENAAATAVDASITVTDPDIAGATSGATVAITGNYKIGKDSLTYTGGPATITGSFNGATATLTLLGSATATTTDWQNALRAVKYVNSSDDPNGTASSAVDTLARTVTWTFNDGMGQGNSAAASVTSTVNVTSVNDAPTAAAVAVPGQAGIPIVFPAGTLHGTDLEDASTALTVDLSGSTVTGGTLSGTAATDGSFTFTALPTSTTATFTYTVKDSQGLNSAPATVSLTVAGPAIFFVKNTGSGTTCTLGSECTLAQAVTNGGLGANAKIFLNDSATYSTPSTLTLASNNWIFGLGARASGFANLFGLSTPASGTLATLPTITTSGGTGASVIASVTLANAAQLRGFNLFSATSTSYVLSGTTGSSIVVSDMTVNGPRAISLSGVGGTFAFSNVTSGGATAPGIILANTTGSFTVSPPTSGACTSGPSCLGGSVNATVSGQDGISLKNTGTVLLNNMLVLGNGRNGIVSTDGGDVTINNCMITNSSVDGVHSAVVTTPSTVVSKLTVTNSIISTNGNGGIFVGSDSNANTKFTITNNTVNSNVAFGISLNSASTSTSSGSAFFRGVLDANHVLMDFEGSGGAGIDFEALGSAPATAVITNNTVSYKGGLNAGIVVHSGDNSTAAGVTNVQFLKNQVTVVNGTDSADTPIDGIDVESGLTNASTRQLNMSFGVPSPPDATDDNAVTLGTDAQGAGTFLLRVSERHNAIFKLLSLTPDPSTTTTSVASYLANATNIAATVRAASAAFTVNYTAVAAIDISQATAP